MDLGAVGRLVFFKMGFSSAEASEAARKIEQLGYGTLWIPETVWPQSQLPRLLGC